MHRAYVGVGSNLGDSAGIVREAFDRLRALGTAYVNSDLYLTQPWGVRDQEPFINAVAAFDTSLPPRELLARLHAIENDYGRERAGRWEPRTLDLDVLLYGDERIDEPGLEVPHGRLAERAFALAPLAEIAPDAVVAPDGRTAAELFAALPADERRGAIRLPGTAALVPPPRLDYDAPGGAGEGYDTLRPFSAFDQACLDAVVKSVGPLAGKRILDIGCGTGRFTQRLHELGARVTGLDPSETMLAAARKRAEARPMPGAPPAEYVRGDANDALPRGPFGAITAFYSIHYVAVAPFAGRALDALAPGGVLSIATFPHRHFAEVLYARYFPSLPAIDMARFPSAPSLARDLGAAGFARVESRDVRMTLDDDPQALIERIERKFLSSFFLIPDDEFKLGLARMREDWAGRSSVSRAVRAMVVSGRAPDAGRR